MHLFQEYFVDVVRYHYADIDGRARRKQYWMFTLFDVVIGLAVAAIFGLVSQNVSDIASGLYTLALFAPGLGLTIRRLHDTSRSGWYLLIGIIPILGWIALFYFLCDEGDAGPNEYGPDPKDPYNDMDEIEDFKAVLDR